MHSLSLKFRITALALIVAVVPLFIFNLISAKSTRDNMVQTVSNSLQAESIFIGDAVRRYLSQRLIDIKTLRRSWIWGDKKQQQVRSYIEKIVSEHESIDNIMLVGLDGKVLVSGMADQSEGYYLWDVNAGTKELFQAALISETGGAYATEARPHPNGTRINLLSAVKGENGTIL